MIALSRIYKCRFVIHSTNKKEIQVDSFENEDQKNKNVKEFNLAYHLNVTSCCLICVGAL